MLHNKIDLSKCNIFMSKKRKLLKKMSKAHFILLSMYDSE